MKGLMHRGMVLFLVGMMGAAMSIPSREMAVAQESVEAASGQEAEADLLLQKGSQAFKTSQFGVALESLQRALALYREIGNREGEAASLGGVGLAYLNLGQYNKAIDFHTQSLDIAREIGHRQGEAASLGNLGNSYLLLGQYNKAIEFQTQHRDISREIGHRLGEAQSLGNLGISYLLLGQYNKAIEFHTQHRDISREIGHRLGEAQALGNLGLAYRNLGESNKAIEFHTQTLDISREIGYGVGEASSLGGLAIAHHRLGQYEKAITFQKQAFNIARKIGYRYWQAGSLSHLGYMYLGQKDYPQAATYLKQSIELSESLRDKLETEQRISIFEAQAHSYRAMQMALMAQEKPEQALEYAERGRTRALIQQLHALSPEKEQPVPTHPSITQIKNIAINQKATLVEYTLIHDELLFIWVVKPDGSIHHEIVNPEQLGTGIKELNKNLKPVLELARGTDKTDSLIPSLLEKSQISNTTNTRSNQDETPDSETDLSLLQNLHAFLIEPIEEHLPQNPEEKVIIIPHRSLFRVPFPALLENKAENPQYLIDKHTLITVPSIHALSYAKQQPQGKPQSFLIAGNPTLPADADPKAFTKLPGAEEEAKAIAALFKDKAKAVTGKDATESLVREKLGEADIIHLAAHGKFDDPEAEEQLTEDAKAEQPQVRPGSYIVLAPGNGHDGYLDAKDLVALTANKTIQADMVVLSACETGLGQITGDGVLGLSRALTAAGVPSVVVSLWSVGDTSTATLMQEFYRNVYVLGMDKAKGLKAAMLTVRQEYPDPGHWAGFTLIGQAD